MRKLSMIALLAAGLSLPLSATAQSRYIPSNTPAIERVQLNGKKAQIVSQGHARHGNVGPNQRGGVQPEIIAISALAVLAAIGLHHH